MLVLCSPGIKSVVLMQQVTPGAHSHNGTHYLILAALGTLLDTQWC